MSLAAFTPSQGAIAQFETPAPAAKPPPKRTIIAIADNALVSEAR